MKTIIHITLLLLSFSLTAFSAPIKNAKTETFKVSGICGMCQKTIETAAYKKGEAKAECNSDSKIVSITFDTTKTSADAVLKRIAYAGYDNEIYLAPVEAYTKLPQCCQYERQKKEMAEAETKTESEHHTNRVATTQQDTAKPKVTPPLDEVFTAYFAIKDALTRDDATTAAEAAKDLSKAIDAVKMETLSPEVHTIWMKYKDKLSSDAEHINGSKEEQKQRDSFAALSKSMYELIKVAKPAYPIYYDHCPMYNSGKGADWLSKENTIKNPYFGSQMINCGKTTETIGATK